VHRGAVLLSRILRSAPRDSASGGACPRFHHTHTSTLADTCCFRRGPHIRVGFTKAYAKPFFLAQNAGVVEVSSGSVWVTTQ
jgi:hypothetical protein